MTYVFDTSSFIVLGHYFPGPFRSFWERFDSAVSLSQVLSVREVYNELDNNSSRPHLRKWIGENKHVFLIPTEAETNFVSDIFAIPRFRELVGAKQRLKGTAVADPFVIAAAAVRHAHVVTEEAARESAPRIPDVCRHFGVECINLEGFMALEGWEF